LDWVRQTLARREPAYRFKWDIYFDRLEELAKFATRFLDAGCGDNKTASELVGPKICVGVDVAGLGVVNNAPVGAYCPAKSGIFDNTPPRVPRRAYSTCR
jgi:hypothetical protein